MRRILESIVVIYLELATLKWLRGVFSKQTYLYYIFPLSSYKNMRLPNIEIKKPRKMPGL
jgi:hypothetical protein